MASTEDIPSPSFLPSWLSDRLASYIRIGQVFQSAAYYFLRDLWAGIRQGHLAVLFGRANQEVRDQAFADWFRAASHDISQYEATTALPSLVASAHGIVIDLGPGTGNQLERFDASRIEHAYGVEPNTAFAEPFMARLKTTQVGQDGKYTLVPCGIEDVDVLERHGLVEGSIDCVVSTQVMCSLPDLEQQVRHMHRLLKPGGELIFFEHCRNEDPITRAVQWLWDLVWPSVIGGCRLDRVTRDILVKAVDWEVVEIHTDAEAHMTMPRIWGRLVKQRAS